MISKYLEIHTLPLMASIIFAVVFSFNVASSRLGVAVERISLDPGPVWEVLSGPVRHRQAAGVLAGRSETDLAAHWAFDEGEGTLIRDDSVWRNVGELRGGPAWVPGKRGAALFFDGHDDYILVDDGLALRLADTFTLAAWVKSDGDETRTILSKNGFESDSFGGYLFALSDNSVLYGVRRGAALGGGDSSLDSGKWVHVAAVYDAADLPSTRIYVNGAMVLLGNLPAPDITSASLLIGRDSGGDYFKGMIDELSIYTRALSPAEVGELYTSIKDEPTDANLPVSSASSPFL